MTKLSKNIRTYRKKAGMTQQELADKLSLSKPTISKYELGTVEPSITSLKQMSEIFDVTIDTLVGNSSEKVTFAAHTFEELDEEGIQKLQEFKEFLLTKYRK